MFQKINQEKNFEVLPSKWKLYFWFPAPKKTNEMLEMFC
jgi:hypothetical protein